MKINVCVQELKSGLFEINICVQQEFKSGLFETTHLADELVTALLGGGDREEGNQGGDIQDKEH